MQEPTITLYDLASRSEALGSGSPFAWQIRLALNYKQLHFKTIWLHMTDIGPTFESIGITPSKYPFAAWNAEPRYTVPVLMDSSTPGSPIIISESLPIAEYLEKAYPHPPLFPKGAETVLSVLDQYIQTQLLPLLVLIFIPKTNSFLAEKDRAYFTETRELWLGKKFEDLLSENGEAEENWKRLQDGFEELARLIDKNGEKQPWVVGDRVSRVDFVLIGIFIWMMKVDPKGWARVEKWDNGRWGRMMKMSENWRANEA